MNKPDRILDSLGPNVEITNHRLPKDVALAKRLKGIGKDMQKMTDEPLRYCGSYATHLYMSEFNKEIRFIHHHAFDKNLSEKVMSASVGDLALHLMQVLFGRKKPATRDPKDLRGKKV